MIILIVLAILCLSNEEGSKMERQLRCACLHKSQSEWSGMCAMSALLGCNVECITTSLQTHKPSRQEAKNHRLFQLLAKETGEQHVGLQFYTKFDGCRGANASLSCMNSEFWQARIKAETRSTPKPTLLKKQQRSWLS